MRNNQENSKINRIKKIFERLGKRLNYIDVYKEIHELDLMLNNQKKIIIATEGKSDFEIMKKMLDNCIKSNEHIINIIESCDAKFLYEIYYNSIKNELWKLNDNLTLKKLESITLLSKIQETYYSNIEYLIKFNSFTNDDIINNNLTKLESIIPQYLGYAYRKDSSISIQEAYERSSISTFESNTISILEKIKKINIIKEGFFKLNNEIITFGVNIQKIVNNEKDFSYIINLLFKSVYEGSGISNNRIYSIGENNPKIKDTLDLIKHFRNFFDHSTDATNKTHTEHVLSYIKETIGTKYPSCPKEWRMLQERLYIDINDMLDEIIKILD